MIFSLILFFATQAFAYIPPPHFIVDKMMKNREGLKSAELVAEVKDLQRNMGFTETLRLDFVGGRYWMVVIEPDGQVVTSKVGKLTDLKKLSQAWIEIGIDPSEYRFREAMQQLETWPTEKTEVKLLRGLGGKKIYWSWGNGQQLKIEKDQFVWAGFTDEDGNELEVREQSRFPKMVFLKHKGQEKYQYNLKTYKMNTPVKWNAANQAANMQITVGETVRDWMELVR